MATKNMFDMLSGSEGSSDEDNHQHNKQKSSAAEKK